MSMGGGRGPGTTLSEINVTPLVDVMLVLLIIFMVSAPMLQRGVEVDLPSSHNAPPMKVDEAKLKITLKPSAVKPGAFEVDIEGTPVPLAALKDVISRNAKIQRDKEIYLAADGSVPYREVVKVMTYAKEAGAAKVGLVLRAE
jgi:biopolymer transport protein TolR